MFKVIEIKKDNKIKEGFLYVNQTLELCCDEIKAGDAFTINFKCDDGVDFKINEIAKADGLKYEYLIPKGMAGQTYHISIKKGGFLSNEETIKVEMDINNVSFNYNGKDYFVKSYDDVYLNKRYFSLDDLNNIFVNTTKFIKYNRLQTNKIIINDIERRYFTIMNLDEPFIYITDCQFVFDINLDYIDNKYVVSDNLYIDKDKLDSEMFFSYLHGCIVGDIDTGKIFYKKNENNVCAIASTSKLLTLLLTREEIEKGNLNLNSLIKIPLESETEALSEDGVVYLKKGMELPLYDVLDCLMLPSSNECAMALGINISGSETEFVKKMNDKCKELGLVNSYFYNTSGLPYYPNKTMPGKLQNRMTAYEMFKLASHIVKTYPDLINVTSKKHSYIKSLDVTLTNTNPLLFNLDNCVGLKTGTTNRAGCCLVSLCNINNHRIVSVVFGAETSQERGEKSQILMQIAKQEIE